MKLFPTHILILCAFSLAAISNSSAQNIITFSGIDYLLDSNTVLLDAENIYKSPLAVKDASEAFAKINDIGKDATLLIAPSVYWIDDPDDAEIRTDKDGTPYGFKIYCDNLRMIGLSDNPEDVVLAANRGQTQGAVGNFTLFQFNGSSLTTENITFGNYCNIDLNYKRNPNFNRPRRKDAIVQAQIGICNGTDKLFAKNCQFLSRLNLCPFVGARRSLYEGCYFESTDDALSGSAIYLNCKFLFCSSKPFYSTDKTGAVFLNCDIRSLCSGDQYFTKVPGQVAVIDTRFEGADNLNIGWTRDASDLKCFQHNISLNSKPYTIDANRPDLSINLDGIDLMDAYVVECNGMRFYNLPNLLNGQDGWDPMGMNAMVAEAEKTLGKKLTGIPVTIVTEGNKKTLQPQNDTLTVVSTSLLWGGYPTGNRNYVTYISDNKLPDEIKQTISVGLPSGLSASHSFGILPLLKKAPTCKKAPKIYFDADRNEYYVDYKLSDKGVDESMIYWARIVKGENNPRVYLLKKDKGTRGISYRPKMGDYGCEIMAIVVPKFTDSHTGEMVMSAPIEIDDIEDIAQAPESSLTTNFRDVPIVGKAFGTNGVWSFDVYKPLDTSHVTNWKAEDVVGWYYGKGFDASVSEGIVQTVRGARMSYVPARDNCRNMTADLVVEPAKSGGQGFGSATSQYMDICLKFDPLALDGYALRIERTPDYDKAVKFSFVKYEKGNTKIINEGVASNCYRTPCYIHAEIKNGVLSASVLSDAEPQTLSNGVVDAVNISSQIEDNDLTGFCIQHTGSTGPSSTLIKEVKLKWE